ncbi:unnamed protein product [Closterium sp. Naga37s-1]|nr:unnamed protein product [Closterium sp. Naga37s-1]
MLLISPFFFWGSSMVAMKDVLPKAGPMFVASVRLIPAGLLLVAFAASRGRPMHKSALAWFSILLFALVDATAFQGCLTEGLRRTSAGLGSVIIDSQPLTVAVLAALLFGETISKKGSLGLVLGVVGLLLLEVPLDALLSFASSLSASSTQSMLATLPLDSPLSLLDITPSLTDSTVTLAAAAAAAAAEATAVAPAALALTSPAAAALGVGDWQLWESGEWWMLLAAQSMVVPQITVNFSHCTHSSTPSLLSPLCPFSPLCPLSLPVPPTLLTHLTPSTPLLSFLSHRHRHSHGAVGLASHPSHTSHSSHSTYSSHSGHSTHACFMPLPLTSRRHSHGAVGLQALRSHHGHWMAHGAGRHSSPLSFLPAARSSSLWWPC